jgi:hypothetical protein
MSINGLFIDSRETRSKTAVLINVKDPNAALDIIHKNPDLIARVLDSIVDAHKAGSHPMDPSVDAAKNLILQVIREERHQAISEIKASQQNLHARIVGAVDATNASMREKIDEITSVQAKATWNSGTKGQLSEQKLLYALKGALNVDNLLAYEVLHTGSKKDVADICVKYPGFTDIVIDTKDHSKTVPSDQIDKFHKDIRSTMSHGIMISFNTRIAGKKPFDIEILPGCSRIAAFLAIDGNFDIGVVVNVIKVIHMLDDLIVSKGLVDASQDHPEMTKARKAISSVMIYLAEYHRKAGALAQHAKAILALVDEFDFGFIYKTLHGIAEPLVDFVMPPSQTFEQIKHICHICPGHKGIASSSGYAKHMREHAQLPSIRGGHVVCNPVPSIDVMESD